MARKSGKRPKFRKRRGFLGTLALGCGGIIALGMVALLILYAAHRPTFDKIGTAFGVAQRGMVVTFWQDVAYKVVEDAGLEDDERVAGHDTVSKLAHALREGRGSNEQQVKADQAAHAFIEQFESGAVTAEKVRPVLAEAEAILAEIEGGDSSSKKKKSSKKKG
jgi:hypothetical protein